MSKHSTLTPTLGIVRTLFCFVLAVLVGKDSLYILETNSLLDIRITDICS